MFANAVVVTLIGTFVIVVILGHILLATAVWRDLSAAPEAQPNAGDAGPETRIPAAKTGPIFKQSGEPLQRAKAA